ncbi:MAG: transposase [Bacteroidota bacterium]
MIKTSFTERYFIQDLKDDEVGKKAEAICSELGITRTTFYNWKKRYSGMKVDQLKRLKEQEEENHKLKGMYAALDLDNRMLKDVLS